MHTWSLNLSNDEALVVIEVVNATAEVDGGRKHYFLRVPPNTPGPGR